MLALLTAAPAFAAELSPPPPPAKLLTVDSTLIDLILDPRTRAVIVKHMPGFAERMEAEPEVAQIFGGVSLADMAHDPHVRGMTPEALTKLGEEIAAAQRPPVSGT